MDTFDSPPYLWVMLAAANRGPASETLPRVEEQYPEIFEQLVIDRESNTWEYPDMGIHAIGEWVTDRSLWPEKLGVIAVYQNQHQGEVLATGRQILKILGHTGK